MTSLECLRLARQRDQWTAIINFIRRLSIASADAFSFPHLSIRPIHRSKLRVGTVSEWGVRLTSSSTISISFLKGEKNMSFNKITIVGYLGRDPELRYTPQGTAVCNVSVATTERRKNVTGEYEDHTTWFRVTFWNRQAELANEYLAKGRQVYIEGRLRQEEYTDREGNIRTILEVNATEMQFLGRREDSEYPALANAGPAHTEEAEEVAKPAANGSGRSGKKGSKRAAKEMVSVEDTVDDEVPF